MRRVSLWGSSFYNWILFISCSFLRWRGAFPICDVCYYFEVPRSAVCRFLSFLVRNISEPFNSNYDFWASGVEILAFKWEWTILVDLIMEQITTRIFQWDSPRDTAMTMGSNRLLENCSQSLPAILSLWETVSLDMDGCTSNGLACTLTSEPGQVNNASVWALSFGLAWY